LNQTFLNDAEIVLACAVHSTNTSVGINKLCHLNIELTHNITE